MANFSDNTDDVTLWNYLRNGDEIAYSELARRHYRTLIQYGLRFTPNMQLIEDTLQDLLVHLWLHRESINETPSVKFYLIKSFRHRILKTLKPINEVELTDYLIDLHSEFSCEESMIQVESDLAMKKQIKTILERLPSRQQEVIYLRYFQNLKPEEIANLLSINAQSVSNIIQRALSNLRNLWPQSSFSLLFYAFCQTLY
ncbi:RNA polymerase sigma factor [Dyadobacter sp. CY323]|uniref:RNA polymerase sigma factor n=1 Tax=Dyadobacter sp. CY323 TaxID=2907302 RepID=UPI001F47B19F|nr:sigma-70 family RNA polymerase sigma factor [Dyadobacter sp. CY323]MCE6989331.1 sigma-70 family RNA polymerase sigma factor [Dyadobacter sp. CY323]